MRNINLMECISDIHDIAYDIEGLVKIEMSEVKTLINKGFVCDDGKTIIDLLECVEGELLSIAKDITR